MSNPFQDQLLKAGLVTKQQVLKAKRDKHMQTKQQRGTNTATVDETTVDETKARAQQIVAEKRIRHVMLTNSKKNSHARKHSMQK